MNLISSKFRALFLLHNYTFVYSFMQPVFCIFFNFSILCTVLHSCILVSSFIIGRSFRSLRHFYSCHCVFINEKCIFFHLLFKERCCIFILVPQLKWLQSVRNSYEERMYSHERKSYFSLLRRS